VGSKSRIVNIPYDQAYVGGFEDMMRRVPDCAKLEAAIGFRPHTNLDTIIADVLAEKRSRLAKG
jgi:UDP-glucose 4-epimerase